jgi:predicted RNA-binding Zn-ribbon protein involved in translation (DUF1610 family)
MDKQELLEVLRIQSILGRTKSGWDLGHGMLGASFGSESEIENDEFTARECLNCGIILSGELFVAGCPNCGCKDHQNVYSTNKMIQQL